MKFLPSSPSEVGHDWQVLIVETNSIFLQAQSISHSFSFYLPFFSVSVSQDFVGEGEKAGIKDNGTIQINRFSPKFDFHGEAKKSL